MLQKSLFSVPVWRRTFLPGHNLLPASSQVLCGVTFKRFFWLREKNRRRKNSRSKVDQTCRKVSIISKAFRSSYVFVVALFPVEGWWNKRSQVNTLKTWRTVSLCFTFKVSSFWPSTYCFDSQQVQSALKTTDSKKKKKSSSTAGVLQSHVQAMCLIERHLVWGDVAAKNLNEDKLAPAGAIGHKMNPLCTEGEEGVGGGLLHPSPSPIHILLCLYCHFFSTSSISKNKDDSFFFCVNWNVLTHDHGSIH